MTLTSSLRCLRHCTGSTSVLPASLESAGSSVAASSRRLLRTLLASSPMLLPLRFCSKPSLSGRTAADAQPSRAPEGLWAG